MKKSELKQLIREVISEISSDDDWAMRAALNPVDRARNNFYDSIRHRLIKAGDSNPSQRKSTEIFDKEWPLVKDKLIAKEREALKKANPTESINEGRSPGSEYMPDYITKHYRDTFTAEREVKLIRQRFNLDVDAQLSEEDVKKLYSDEEMLSDPYYKKAVVYHSKEHELILFKIQVNGRNYFCLSSPNWDDKWYKI